MTTGLRLGKELPQKVFHIPSLDGIRALAFGLVFLGHVRFGGFIPAEIGAVPARFGVTVFFFLSGYLITTLLRREQERFQRIDFQDFYLRRVLRIWPPFYLVLFAAIGLAIAGYLPSGITIRGTLAQVFHVANYWGVTHEARGIVPGTIVLWSLAVEEHFYLIFPWIYWLLHRFRFQQKQQALALWGLCGVILLWRCVLIFGLHASDDRVFFASDTRFDSLLFGCALGVYKNPVLDRNLLKADRWRRFLLPLSLTVLVLTLLPAPWQWHETIYYTIQGIALYAVFITAVRYANWRWISWLNHPWMQWIGKLSYSLYLTHYIIWFGIAQQLPNWPMLPRAGLTLLLSLLASYLIYRLVEQPCAHFKQVLRKRLFNPER